MSPVGQVALRGVSLSILAVSAASAVVLTTLVAARNPGAMPNGTSFVTRDARPDELGPRLAALDAAIARSDLSRAVYEWRDAYGAALRTRRWDAMSAAGDAALRVDALARRGPGGPSAFRAEARRAYLRALFLARAAGSVHGVDRVANAFASLGDFEMAARARTVLEARR
jgi:hypothetical protein